MTNNVLTDETEFVPFEFKLGKLDKVELDLAPLRNYFEGGQLPAAPIECKYALKVNYPLACNGSIGDCVVAGWVHLAQATTHENDGTYSVPGDPEIKTEYFNLTGGQDTGLAESTFLQTAQKTSILGSQVDVFGSLNYTDLSEVKSGIYTFGAIFLGVTLPQSAENQFPGNWTVVPGSPIIGGHCVLAIGYSQEGVYLVTWGKVIMATWEWFTAYVDEAYGVLTTEEVQKNRGPLKTLDITRLRADIAAL